MLRRLLLGPGDHEFARYLVARYSLELSVTRDGRVRFPAVEDVTGTGQVDRRSARQVCTGIVGETTVAAAGQLAHLVASGLDSI